MPDLTVETRVVCAQNVRWERVVPGSKGDHTVTYGRDYDHRRQYDYDYACTCESFKFRRKCRHIEQVKSERCTWGDALDISEYVETCPQCGGPTNVIRVAV